VEDRKIKTKKILEGGGKSLIKTTYPNQSIQQMQIPPAQPILIPSSLPSSFSSSPFLFFLRGGWREEGRVAKEDAELGVVSLRGATIEHEIQA
jgi:hypothetical protein